jgi:hypothetical protein
VRPAHAGRACARRIALVTPTLYGVLLCAATYILPKPGPQPPPSCLGRRGEGPDADEPGVESEVELEPESEPGPEPVPEHITRGVDRPAVGHPRVTRAENGALKPALSKFK